MPGNCGEIITDCLYNMLSCLPSEGLAQLLLIGLVSATGRRVKGRLEGVHKGLGDAGRGSLGSCSRRSSGEADFEDVPDPGAAPGELNYRSNNIRRDKVDHDCL